MGDSTRNIGFLVYEVSRLMRRKLDRRLQPMELTQVKWRALAMLARHEGTNQATLAEALEVRPITLARLIDRLAEAGWVERRPDPDDRRACRLYLTSKAQPLLVRLRAQAAAVRKEAMAGLSPEVRETLVNALGIMKQNLGGDAHGTPHQGADDNAD